GWWRSGLGEPLVGAGAGGSSCLLAPPGGRPLNGISRGAEVRKSVRRQTRRDGRRAASERSVRGRYRSSEPNGTTRRSPYVLRQPSSRRSRSPREQPSGGDQGLPS